MHRLLPSLSLPLLCLAACGQDSDDPATREGPAIAYEDAFPTQKGFDRPLFVAFDASDPGMAYVVTQPGRVYRVPRDPKAEDRTVFLDLSDRVLTQNWEEGLLGFAFDPGYAENGFVYVYWSEEIPERKEQMADGTERASTRQSVISRFTAVDRDATPHVDLDSELRVLEVFEPFGNHNGGTILFGPDGMLYVALGDGGMANDPYGAGESLGVLLGKVLRLDVRGATASKPYAVPADNPFVGRDGARGEIWCYGLRNVWRMAFDPATGELWCGDVGQNAVEEVDRLVRGGFYGWNSFEGSTKFALRRAEGRPTPEGAIPPITEYTHRRGLSITGGQVYRGKKIPGLVGRFVFADFMTRRAWACATEPGEDGRHEVVSLASAPNPPTSIVAEPEGELLVTCFRSGQGRVFRIVPAE